MSITWPKVVPDSLVDEALEAEVAGLVAGMSVEQKVGQMIQPEIRYITPAELAEYHIGSVLSGGGAPPSNNRQASVAEWLSLADEFHDALQASNAVTPLIWGIDAIHGNNNLFGATLFPHNIGLGASRNPELARRIAEATALEVAATGLDWTFAPTLAVARDDRWGRTYESFSESPELVRQFSAPVTEGYQGLQSSKDFLQGPHIIATAKHYLGDGGTAGGVDQGDTLCDELTLRDVHAVGYFESLAAGAQTVMVSFSSWQGNKMHGHQYLIQTVLKDQMGFDGIVVSDWNGHGQLAASSNVKGEEAINAGIDMLMAPEDWRGLWRNTVEQVMTGFISQERLNDAVSRILRVKLRAGLRFPNRPSSRVCAGKAELIGCPAHRELARQAVRESAVLLKNDHQVLPLKPGARVLVTGAGADDVAMQAGGWSLTWQGEEVGNDDFPGATTVFSAVQASLAAAGGSATLVANPDTVEGYDVAVVIYGETPYAEGQGDRKHMSYSASRPEDLGLLLKLKALGIPVVSIFLSGRPLWVNPELNASDAFVAAWLPGTEAQGLADLLCSDGAFDFVGKLPFSWPAEPLQSPLNVGDQDYAPLFPFGFGLSLRDEIQLGANLSENDTTIIRAPDDLMEIFDLRVLPPFKMFVGDEANWHSAVKGRDFTSRHGVVEVHTTDWQRQEDARRIRWHGGAGQLFFAADESLDCRQLIGAGAKLYLTLCVHSAPTGSVLLRQDSIYPGHRQFDITDALLQAPIGEWQTIEVDLSVSDTAEFQAWQLTTPCLIWTEGRLELSIAGLRIENTERQLAA